MADQDTQAKVIDSPTDKANSNTSDALVVKMVMELQQAAAQYRKKYDYDWSTNQEYYDGKQWQQAPNAAQSRPVLNVMRSTLQTLIPLLTDASPGINVLPAEPSDYEFALMLDEVVRAWWDKNTMDMTLLEVVFDCMLNGTGFLKTTWDPEALDGAGDVRCVSVDPADLYIDPAATAINNVANCGYLIQRFTRTVGELRTQYPDKADQIVPDDSNKKEEDKQKGDGSVQLVSPTDKDVGFEPTPKGSGDDIRKTVLGFECWLKDDTVEEFIAQAEDGSEYKQLKKKYPHGRLITILPAKKILLQDEPNPYSHRQIPYAHIVNFKMPRTIYGEGEGRALIEFQKILNKLLQHTIDHNRLMANPIWIIEDGSGVKSERITNQTALIVNTAPNKASGVRREFPPSMPSGALDLMQWVLRQVESISGATDITQGRRPQGITAAQAIETLQESSLTRIRLKERCLNNGLQAWASQFVGLIMQYYDTPRVIKITGKTTGWPNFFEFFVEQKEDMYQGHKTPYLRDEANKTYVQGQMESTGLSKGNFDIRIASGTNLPFAKAQRANVAFKLFEMQAIDQQELLDALEWPNAEKVVEKTRAQMQNMPPEQKGIR